MDILNSSVVDKVYFALLVFIGAVITKVAWGRITADHPAPRNALPHPPGIITGITSD